MVNKWHDWLGMPKQDKQWHMSDMADETAEYDAETNWLKKWSELSDVVYTCSRGRWSGHSIRFPFKNWQYLLGLLYMFPKYTVRWLFFRSAGKKANPEIIIREVRNPKKTYKLHTIAEKYGIEPQVFQVICEKKMKYWILFP